MISKQFLEHYYIVETVEKAIDYRLHLESETDDLADYLLDCKREKVDVRNLDYSLVFYAIFQKKDDKKIVDDLEYEELEKFINNLEIPQEVEGY